MYIPYNILPVPGVIDPSSNEEVSMQKAVMLGIINSANGTYVNSVTGESFPIPVAMNAGLIKVPYLSHVKFQVSMGLP